MTTRTRTQAPPAPKSPPPRWWAIGGPFAGMGYEVDGGGNVRATRAQGAWLAAPVPLTPIPGRRETTYHLYLPDRRKRCVQAWLLVEDWAGREPSPWEAEQGEIKRRAAEERAALLRRAFVPLVAVRASAVRLRSILRTRDRAPRGFATPTAAMLAQWRAMRHRDGAAPRAVRA